MLNPASSSKQVWLETRTLAQWTLSAFKGGDFPAAQGTYFTFLLSSWPNSFLVAHSHLCLLLLLGHLWEGLALVSSCIFSGSEQPQISASPLIPATLTALWWTCLSFSVVLLSLKSPGWDPTLQRRYLTSTTWRRKISLFSWIPWWLTQPGCHGHKDSLQSFWVELLHPGCGCGNNWWTWKCLNYLWSRAVGIKNGKLFVLGLCIGAQPYNSS